MSVYVEGGIIVWIAEKMKCRVDTELEVLHVHYLETVFASTVHTSSPGHTHLYPTFSSLQRNGINFYLSLYNTKCEAAGFEPQTFKNNRLVC